MCASRVVMAVLLLLLPFTSSAQWLQFGAVCPENSEPTVIHNITLDDLITFDVELHGLLADTVINDSIPYLRFKGSPGTTPVDSVGFPELPAVVCFVAVPDEADLELTCISSCPRTLSLNLPVYPAPMDSLYGDSTSTPYYEEYFYKDSSAYVSEEWYPEDLAEIVGDFHLRDQRVAIVSVHPVQYLASEDSLRVWTDLGISVHLDGEELDWNEDGLGYYDLMVEDLLIGYDPDYQPIENDIPNVVRHTSTTIQPTIDPDYIILVTDGLDGAWVDSFASYRSDLNKFDVLIANLDDVMTGYSGSSTYPTPAIIRDYLEALWDWSPAGERPTYLLLIGDHEDPPMGISYPDWFLPSRTVPDACNIPEAPFEAANDDWYVYFDESRDVFSMLPDMMVGRLSARTDEELQPMLEAIMDFEEPASHPAPGWMANRRRLLRFSGQDAIAPDSWYPSEAWLAGFANWMDYDYDSYYCGDGEDTEYTEDPPNMDGSSMTSEEWVNHLTDEFEEGFQLGFYTNHGCEHFFSAGLNWEIGGPPNFGIPDSCFDCFDVEDSLEVPEGGHLPPFLLMLCCSAGTFNHTMAQHIFYDVHCGKHKCYCYFEGDSLHPAYDFGTDCLAETFVKNSECGTIGVFASSNPSLTGFYQTVASGIMEGLYWRGLTRIGDAVNHYRLQTASSYVLGDGLFLREFARFNLLGDPAVDLGDRMKYPANCDIIISPSDLALTRYPTCRIDGGDVIFNVTVRNVGGSDAGAFDVDLLVQDDLHSDTVTVRCPGLVSGQQTTLEFDWSNHGWFTPPGTLSFTAIAENPGGLHPDSWTGNNGATVEVEVLDFYPNDTGWPVRTIGSISAPPMLLNLDNDDDLEIVVVSGQFILALDPDDPSEPIWISGPFSFLHDKMIPVGGDIDDDGIDEIVMAVRDGLIILDGTDGEVIDEEPYYECCQHILLHPNTVTLADVFPGNDGLEIAAVYKTQARSPALHILELDNGSIVELDTEALPIPTSSPTYYPNWIVAYDGTPDASDELCLSYSWVDAQGYHSGLWIYDHDEISSTSGFTDSETWNEDQHVEAIPAIGSLPQSGITIALSRLRNYYDPGGTDDVHPAWLLDPDDLTNYEECAVSVDTSDHVLCCCLADWDAIVPGADRVLANAENQRFGWYQNGLAITGYPGDYSTSNNNSPPFPALGNLDDAGVADLLVAINSGYMMAYKNDGDLQLSLGFPYTLPSDIPGGFAIADIDNDGYVEVVFGTTDNYLHVWEFGECEEGYAPWSQCQHDAGRTGVLLEE